VIESAQALASARGNVRRDRRRQITYMLLLLDVLGICVADMVALLAFPNALADHPTLNQMMVPLYMALAVVLMGQLEAYSVLKLYRLRPTIWRTAFAHLGTAIAINVLTILMTRHGVHLAYLGSLATMCWAVSLVFRLMVRRWEDEDIFQLRALILGAGESALFLKRSIEGAPQVLVLGLVTCPRDKAEPEAKAFVLGDAEDLVELSYAQEADVVVIATSNGLTDHTYTILSLCAERGVRVERMAEFYEQWLMMVPVSYVNQGWCVHGFGYQVEPYYDYLHRAVDIAAATVGLVIFALLYVPVGLAIKLTSPGPILFSPDNPRFFRVGMRGRQFRIYKFRTMLHNAPAPINYTADNDPRITKIGKLLRKTKIDELPQLWNVLMGDMSLIGPRPLSVCEDEEMLQTVPLQHLRRVVRPGLTGLGQVTFGTANTPEEHLVRLQSDLYYVKHRSLALDIWILAQTLFVCLGLQKRR